MVPQLVRTLFGGLLAAACGAALADAADDALVFRAITLGTAEAAKSSQRARDALGGEPLEVSPWWRGAVSAPLRGRGATGRGPGVGGGRGGGFGSGFGFGSVASASFTVTGPPESGSRSADVVVLAVAAREEEKQKGGDEEEGEEKVASASSTSSSASSPPPPPPPPDRSLGALLRSLPRRWSPRGWSLVSADITLPRPGGLPGPATGVSLMEEVAKLSLPPPPPPPPSNEKKTEDEEKVKRK